MLAKPNGLDYRNVIAKPASETLYPVELTNFLTYLQEYTNNITNRDWKKKASELANVPELIDVEAKKTEINESLSPTVAEDPGMQLIVKEIKKLRELLPKIKIDNEDDADENGYEDVHEVSD